jgi:hypothetical protein
MTAVPTWLLLERLDTAAHAAARADTALQCRLDACTDAGLHGPVIAARIQAAQAAFQALTDTGPGPRRALQLVTPRDTTGPEPTPRRLGRSPTHTGAH